MPKISVILAAYNHERFVARAIQSVLDQTFEDFELLIADDGSPDRTPEVIKTFCDPRIQAFYFPNNGHQHTRTFCLEKAQGEYIAIQNSDDVYHPAKLEKQIQVLDTRPEVGAVFSWIRLIDEKSEPFPDASHPGHTWFNQPNRPRFEWLRQFYDQRNHLCHPTVLMRRSVLRETGGYSPLLALSSDFDLWMRIGLRHEFHVIPEALVDMRILDGEANASGRKPATVRRSIYEHSKILRHLTSDEAIPLLDRIFPELAGQLEGKTPNARRCLLAEHALQQAQESNRRFGLDLLYELLSDREIEKSLRIELGPGVVKGFLQHTAKSSPVGKVDWTAARLFWPVNGRYSLEQSMDVPVPWQESTTIVFPRIPVKTGDQLIVYPLREAGVVRLKRIALRQETDRRIVSEYLFPRDQALLRAGEETVLLEAVENGCTPVALGSGEGKIFLPNINSSTDGLLRLEIAMEASRDLRPVIAALQSQMVKPASKLRASFVKRLFC